MEEAGHAAQHAVKAASQALEELVFPGRPCLCCLCCCLCLLCLGSRSSSRCHACPIARGAQDMGAWLLAGMDVAWAMPGHA